MGLLALTTRLGPAIGGARRHRRVAERRLGRDLKTLGDDGIAPAMDPGGLADAVMLIGVLDRSGLADVQDLRLRVEDALAWFVLPDGTLVNLGETADETLSGEWGPRSGGPGARTDRYLSVALRSAVSGGEWGKTPGTARVFDSAGYGVIRRNGESHLAISGAEQLAVTWFDRGRRVLVGPGGGATVATTTGDDPRAAISPAAAVRYLDSVRARSTIEIVGSDTATPRGSVSIEADDRATGETDRNGTRHRRHLNCEPGAWLLIVDELESPRATRYRQWLHFAGDLDVVVRDWGVLLSDQGLPFAWVVSAGDGLPITPVRADPVEPVSGWWSPRGRSLAPRWSLGWELESDSATMGVLISLEGRPVVEEQAGSTSWTVGTHRIPLPTGLRSSPIGAAS
jgi:hypothetical protein